VGSGTPIGIGLWGSSCSVFVLSGGVFLFEIWVVLIV
jgi:hypothetical protein